MVHFHLLCEAADAERARAMCPAAGRPDPGGEGERRAFLCDDERTAWAVLSHAWPYDQNNVFVRSIAADSPAALCALVAELRSFLDRNADVCPGLLLSARSVVHPPPGCTAAEVFRLFER